MYILKGVIENIIAMGLNLEVIGGFEVEGLDRLGNVF